MSKKDYEAIAKALSKAFHAGLHDSGAFTTMVFDLCDVLKKDNPSFDSGRFLKAITEEGK